MNREILRIALPNIVSNITVPLMGIVSTAIAGHWGTDSAATIGALAVGVSIFNFIYWNCSFVRMGTSGLTAQAFGAGDRRECTVMLWRALSVAAAMGLLMLVLQYPVGEAALRIMNGPQMTRDYYYARIWAVPAGILLFGFNGWFTGMQNAVIPMCTAIAVNVIHVLCSLWFAFGLNQGIVGIAYASVLAQWVGVALSAVLLMIRYRKILTHVERCEILDFSALRTFFAINRDIMLRTLCIVAVYTFCTAASALTGRFIGARDEGSLRRCLRGCVLWGTGVSVVFVGIYLIGWRELLGLFVSDPANAEAILATAGRYIVWIILIPIASAMPFIMDGIMVGATETRIMRNSMFWATDAYFAIFYAGYPLIGNNALWLAFSLYMFLRGAAQYLLSDRLHAIYRKARQE